MPDGDNRPRLVCGDCGWIHYENPRIIVGVLAEWEGRLLLGRRAIEPRRGFWNVPAGFLELGETPSEGAIREVREETGAEVEIVDLLGVYSVTHIGQVHMIYRGRLLCESVAAGDETLEVGLFAVDQLPWQDLAFPTNHWALEHYLKARGQSSLVPFTEATGDQPSQLR